MGQCLDKERKQVELKEASKGSKKWKRKLRRKSRSNKNRKELSSNTVPNVEDKRETHLEGSSISMNSVEPTIGLSSSSQQSNGNGLKGSHMTFNINIQFNGKKSQESKKGLQSSHVSVSSVVSSKSMDSTETTVVHDSDNDSVNLIPSPHSRKPLSPIKSPLARRGISIFNSPKLQRGPKVLFKSPVNKHLAFRREKNNSTSTLFIKDTLNSPNVDEILRCMSVALLYHIKNGLKAPEDKLARVFSEKYFPLTHEFVDTQNLPEISAIYRFIKSIFKVQKLPPECAILCLAYIERILAGQKIVLHPENWRRIVFGSIIIATKVWEDESVWNVDFLDLFPLLTLNDLNNTENKFLELLEFNVLILGSEYAKYYFELRGLSELDSFPLEPLNKDLQHKLEVRSNSFKSFVPPSVQKEKDAQNKASVSAAASAAYDDLKSTTIAGSLTDALPYPPTSSRFRDLQRPVRCRSMDFLDPKSPPVVIP